MTISKILFKSHDNDKTSKRIEDIYVEYVLENKTDDGFIDFIEKQIQDNKLIPFLSKLPQKDAVIESKAREAKKKIKSSVINEHLDSLHLTRKQRRKEKESYVKTKKFQEKFEEALNEDEYYCLISNATEEQANDIYKKHIARTVRKRTAEIVCAKELANMRMNCCVPIIEKLFNDFDSEKISSETDAVNKICAGVENSFTTDRLVLFNFGYGDTFSMGRNSVFDVKDITTYNDFCLWCDLYEAMPHEYIETINIDDEDNTPWNVIFDCCRRYVWSLDIVSFFTSKQVIRDIDEQQFAEKIDEYCRAITSMEYMEIIIEVTSRFPLEKVLELIETNRFYKPYIPKWKQMMSEKTERLVKIREQIVQSMPEDYVELFPLAREIDRHFIIHCGPTNSGKTYSAMSSLKKAANGAYLSPLRLLAHEQYESLNNDGIRCSLLTGEEKIEVKSARFVSSTIEMLDYSTYYSEIVIDEAQMLEDNDRGCFWTSAIVGAFCPKIHICCSEDATELIVKIIEACGDTYEIVEHKRFVPLLRDASEFKYPSSIQKGDALIVFSRKNVCETAAHLIELGHKVSMIYGKMPYEVKESEAEKFSRGETDIVVATDAIGMGLNLPVKRIVFLENKKFDGTQERVLTASELKQISGRAGRMGMHDVGYWTVDSSVKGQHAIEKKINSPLSQISMRPYINFNDSIFKINAPISEILTQWNLTSYNKKWHKRDVTREIMLASNLEAFSSDKQLIASFISMSFDESDVGIMAIWIELFRWEAFQREMGKKNSVFCCMPHLKEIRNANVPKNNLISNTALKELETLFQIYDLLLCFCIRTERSEDIENIMGLRAAVSAQIIKLMENGNAITAKKCVKCGKTLPRGFEFKMCNGCYRKKGSLKKNNGKTGKRDKKRY